jgi:transcription elongation GreA/GreB family factor
MNNYFTQESLEKYVLYVQTLESELERLMSLVGSTAETGGGWHDNGGLDHLNYDIHVADSRLKSAHDLLNNAKVISYPLTADSAVIGTEVRLRIDGEPQAYSIVCHGDVDLNKNKILYESPLAQVLLYHKTGDKFYDEIAGKKSMIEVIGITPLGQKS